MYTALLLEGLRRQFVFVLCAGLELVGSRTFRPVHVLNIDIKDNHEEATLGAFLVLKLCNMMKHVEDLEDDMEGIIHDFEDENGRTLLHCVLFY
jgi:RNA polymerase II subunit A C-terminal domain phosphatase SSU72